MDLDFGTFTKPPLEVIFYDSAFTYRVFKSHVNFSERNSMHKGGVLRYHERPPQKVLNNVKNNPFVHEISFGKINMAQNTQ